MTYRFSDNLEFFLLNVEEINENIKQYMESNNINFYFCRVTHRESKEEEKFCLELDLITEKFSIQYEIDKIKKDFNYYDINRGGFKKYKQDKLSVQLNFYIKEEVFMNYNFIKSLKGINKFKL